MMNNAAVFVENYEAWILLLAAVLLSPRHCDHKMMRSHAPSYCYVSCVARKQPIRLTVIGIVLYKDSAIIHHALGLQGAPVLQCPNPQASGEAYVYKQLVSGVPDKLVNCVEDAHNTSGPLVEYFPGLFHRLPGKTFMNLILRMKALFPPTDPWVQALPGPLATVFEVRGGMVEMVAQVFIHGPFRYP